VEIGLLGGLGGQKDLVQDTVNLSGTADEDVVEASTINGLTTIGGLPAEVVITGAEAGIDRLQISTSAGDDIVDGSGLAANLFNFAVLVGSGDELRHRQRGRRLDRWRRRRRCVPSPALAGEG
jgi:hypothetical protein